MKPWDHVLSGLPELLKPFLAAPIWHPGSLWLAVSEDETRTTKTGLVTILSLFHSQNEVTSEDGPQKKPKGYFNLVFSHLNQTSVLGTTNLETADSGFSHILFHIELVI